MGYIDKLGRGTIKILEECKALGLQEPKWYSKKDEVTLTFYGPKRNEVTPDEYSIKNSMVSDAVSDAVNDAVKIRLQGIIKLIYQNGSLSLKILVAHFNSSRAKIQRDLFLLVSGNLIQRLGADKFREYNLTDALRKQIDALKQLY